MDAKSALLSGLVAIAALAATAASAGVPVLSVRFSWSPSPAVEMTTDRGYTVRLERAEVMSAGFALVPCAEQGGIGRPGIVRIGHFSGALPNQIVLERAESLIDKSEFVLDGFDPPDIDYCQAHFVLGGPRGGYSLRIDGHYRAPDAIGWTHFSVATPEAFGAFVPIVRRGGVAFRGRLGALHSLEVERPSSGWFDGVDFTSASDVAIGRAVLRRIATATRVTILP